jgi:hypothetical protein
MQPCELYVPLGHFLSTAKILREGSLLRRELLPYSECIDAAEAIMIEINA